MDLGPRVKERRTQRGLSQEKLAHAAGVTMSSIQRLESGFIRDPHYSTLSGIAHVLGTTVAELVGEESEVSAAGKPPAPQGSGQPRAGSAAEGHLDVFLPWDYIEENFSFEQVLELFKGVYDQRVTVYEHGVSISRELMADEVGV
jgi:transcriptional regulator with XRE-family HTH domain